MLGLKTFLALALLVSPIALQASSGSAGYVSNIVYTGYGQVYFNQDGPRSSPASCSTDSSRWAFDPTTAQGQAELSILLTAYSLHKQIYVGGTNTCAAASSDTESVFFFYIVG